MDEAGDSSQSTLSEPSTACATGCCEDLEAPNQPTERSLLYKAADWEYRCFNPLCNDRKKVFCYHCLSAFDKGLLRPTRH